MANGNDNGKNPWKTMFFSLAVLVVAAVLGFGKDLIWRDRDSVREEAKAAHNQATANTTAVAVLSTKVDSLALGQAKMTTQLEEMSKQLAAIERKLP